MDTQVAEHGVGLPAAKQHDGLSAYIGTEEGGRSARAEGACSDLSREDAGARFVQAGGVLEGVGDVGRFGGHEAARRSVKDSVKGAVGRSAVLSESPGDARQGFRRAEEGVRVSRVANPFAFDSVLLSDKFQGCGA